MANSMHPDAVTSGCDIVVVAHPADGGGLHIGEHLAAVVHEDLGLTVLALRDRKSVV